MRPTQQITALIQKGFDFHQKNQLSSAEATYKKVLRIQPNNFTCLQLMGTLCASRKKYSQAVFYLSEAVKINPTHSETYNNLGNVFQELNFYDEALKSYDLAIKINPNDADYYSNRGLVLRKLNLLHDAIKSYEKSLSIDSNDADVYNNFGLVFQELNLLHEAISCFDSAIKLNPKFGYALSNRAMVLFQLKRFSEAINEYEQVISIAPNLEFLLGNIVHLKMFICDWSNFLEERNELSKKILNKLKVSYAFPILSIIDSPKIQKLCAKIYGDSKFPPNNTLGPIHQGVKNDKIRVGYFSGDFKNHAISILTAELFESHDRNNFECIGFSFGVVEQSPMFERIKDAFDQFIDIQLKSDKEVAEMARTLNLDIAVDLTGYTSNCRLGIFSYRAAPIQISYLGYLGTVGMSYIDYILADKILIPQSSQEYFSEKIIFLPHYQVNDSKRLFGEKVYTRSELGLPQNGFVFCCFNNNFKILPETFNSWMKILNAVDRSVLYLYVDNSLAMKNLKKEAESRGVCSNRIIFGDRVSYQDYLSRYKICDLFLDTFPYNAGTTASDALWMGLPVITLIGESFASRMCASLLSSIQIPELITNSYLEYEALAIELATNAHRLSEINERLVINRLRAPLFNCKIFTKNLEKSYSTIISRYHAGMPTENIYVEND